MVGSYGTAFSMQDPARGDIRRDARRVPFRADRNLRSAPCELGSLGADGAAGCALSRAGEHCCTNAWRHGPALEFQTTVEFARWLLPLSLEPVGNMNENRAKGWVGSLEIYS